MDSPVGSDFGLYSGRGDLFAAMGQEYARSESDTGSHDDGLEQSAYGLFFAIFDDAGVEAPGGAQIPASVDAAERDIVPGAGRPMIIGNVGPRMAK